MFQRTSILLVLLLVLDLLQSIQSIFFLVGETQKCFTFEQPRDTPMFFTYELMDEGKEITFDLYYGSNPDPSLQIQHKILTEKLGHIDFTADNDGIYAYCLSQNPNNGDLPVRTKIQINYGFDSEHYEKLIKDHNFDAVNLQVHKLNDLLTMTLNEADYQKHKEVDYHDDTEKMNNAALWWPVVQICILVLTGIYQVQHLKNFFKANKFV